ncbi:MAG: hypothetical protein CBC35_01625 [Planctomycetes bacterium TMED75]|nr:hypothetical protein [Planctomycetaceae bacterium]OUU96259.1 MAG: hypothetical protein CBC35_01625 [Planctomycetes bacterium TMED75]
MDENTFQKKMAELIERIRELPGSESKGHKTKTPETSGGEELQTSLGELQESLDYLRLSVKYLVFDLEATRRENAYLRRLVEQANQERNQAGEPEEEADDFFE